MHRWLAQYPARSFSEFHRCAEALRQYLRIASQNTRPTALPSAAADSVWHLLIEDLDAYNAFCLRTFGRTVPHVEKADFDAPMGNSLFETWAAACHLEGLSARKMTRLPTLFALDADLQWPDGFYYRLTHTAHGTGMQLLQTDGQWVLLTWSVVALLAPAAQAEMTTAAAGSANHTDDRLLTSSWFLSSFNESSSPSSSSHHGDTGHHGGGDHHGSSCGSHASSCGSTGHSCGSSCGSSCGGGGD